MGLFYQFVVGGSLLVLFCTGWAFLDRGLIAYHEEQDLIIQVCFVCTSHHHLILQHDAVWHICMQVLFSTVFAFSVNLLQLVIFEVLGALDYRCRLAYMTPVKWSHSSAPSHIRAGTMSRFSREAVLV